MPIEFYCPGCGNLMRTPDETAGRKGRCPTCQLKVQIPGESVASSASDSIDKPISTAPKNPQAEPIQFECQSCGRTLSVAAANAGKRGQCPHCGGQMSIPLARQAKSASPNKALRETRWKGEPKTQPQLTKAGGEKIEFPCSNCKEVVRVGAAAAGKRGQCPHCKAVIEIPTKSASVTGLEAIPRPQPKPAAPKPPPSDSTPGSTPLPSAPSRQSPTKTTPDLTPLPAEPAQPSSLSLNQPSPLTPPGLTPLEPLGVSPDNDPLGERSTNSANPFDISSNPIPAQMTTPSPHPQPRGGARSGAEVATMICAWLIIAFAGVQLVWVPASIVLQMNQLPDAADMEDLSDDEQVQIMNIQSYGKAVMVGMMIVSIAIYGVTIAGGIQMVRFKTWWLCLISSILCMSPCGCLCLAGLPLGIWGIVMLSLAPVRARFS